MPAWLWLKKKDGRPRRTVDYQQLNSQCIREPNYSDSPFHTARRIPQNTWKCVLDAVDGYHSVELDPESSKLTTFITPWGRYRYLRFPQGHCSAGDAFNGRVQEILSGIPRMVRIVDDMCLYDDTIEGAFWHTWDLLETCAQNGIVINESKLQFCSREIEFAGLTVTADGVQPSKRTMSAIENFPPPTDLTKARAFFGLVNQVQWAYANGKEMAPFRELVKPNSTFRWNDELRELFDQCKKKILHQVREGVKRYDTNRQTCLQTDFSQQGLGYLLLQKYCSCSLERAPLCCNNGWQLVFAGSRFTQGAEKRYAPTEGELLAVAWSLNHAHIFTKGCSNIIISTDHKPLLGILNEKPFEDIKNPRILRLKEQTLSFSFMVTYNQGKWHRGPDALSRNPQFNYVHLLEPFHVSVPEVSYMTDIDATLALTEVGEDIGISVEDVRKATREDPAMKILAATILNGFPQTQHLTDPEIRPFFNVRDHLWIEKEVIMFKKRIVLPKVLRERSLRVLHAAHQGIEGMKARASNSIYWPGLNVAIKQVRDGCNICNKIAPSQPREPIQLISPPAYPFQHVCMDAFEISGKHYLAAVDRYSGWLMIFHVRCHPQSRHVIDSLRSIFSNYGAPDTLFTDGGLPFQGQEVQQFLNTWKVKHVTSSASYPQGNGRAELAVKAAKRLLQENTNSDGSLNTNKASRALLQYRNTPIQHVGLSPAQILFHRNLRDGLPASQQSLKPNKLWVIAADQRERSLAKRNEDLVDRYNRSTRELPVLMIGQTVLIQDANFKKRWMRYGTIVDQNNRKYTIRVHGSGSVITRNRRFLKPANVEQHEDFFMPTGSSSTVQNESSTSSNQTQEDQAENTASVIPNAASSTSDTTQPTDPPILPERSTYQSRMLKRLLPYNKPGLKEQ